VARVFCVANQKGGVGKTTTAVNLAAALARSGAQTLLVDLDPQCNATTGLGRQPTDNHPLLPRGTDIPVCHSESSGTDRNGNGTDRNVCPPGDYAPIRQGVLATDVPRLELLPGSRSFRDVELLTRDDPQQSARLREHLTTGFNAYDFVLIDCPPSLGPLTKTALSSSTEVFMPIQCEYFAMEGLAQMIEVIRDVMHAGQVANLSHNAVVGQVGNLSHNAAAGQVGNLSHNAAVGQVGNLSYKSAPQLQFGGIVLTMYDHTLELTHEVDEEVRDFFGEIVFQTVIPRDVAVSEAPSHGRSVIDYAPRSRGARAYAELCMEVLDRD
jgi:chromosome partitioning protein